MRRATVSRPRMSLESRTTDSHPSQQSALLQKNRSQPSEQVRLGSGRASALWRESLCTIAVSALTVESRKIDGPVEVGVGCLIGLSAWVKVWSVLCASSGQASEVRSILGDLLPNPKPSGELSPKMPSGAEPALPPRSVASVPPEIGPDAPLPSPLRSRTLFGPPIASETRLRSSKAKLSSAHTKGFSALRWLRDEANHRTLSRAILPLGAPPPRSAKDKTRPADNVRKQVPAGASKVEILDHTTEGIDVQGVGGVGSVYTGPARSQWAL